MTCPGLHSEGEVEAGLEPIALCSQVCVILTAPASDMVVFLRSGWRVVRLEWIHYHCRSLLSVLQTQGSVEWWGLGGESVLSHTHRGKVELINSVRLRVTLTHLNSSPPQLD